MMFLYSIFCQWFSRGCLFKCCLEQEKWQLLIVVFLIGFVLGSPLQGYMSDKGSRKHILLLTISCIILSMLTMVIGERLCSQEQLPLLLGIASVINGVFGNVFPVAVAAYSEQINDLRTVVRHAFACKYGALALPFLLQLPSLYGFLIALTINLASVTVIALGFADKKLVKE